MNTNNPERLRNEIPVSGSVPKNIISHYKAEQDNNESNGDYQTSGANTIEPTDNHRLDRLQHSPHKPKFGNHRVPQIVLHHLAELQNIYNSMGTDAGIPVEWDNFGVDLARTNTKWYKDSACINIAKNQFIFMGYKNSTDCFSQIMIKCKEIDVPHILTEIMHCVIIFQM
jgi:hypothetical protein